MDDRERALEAVFVSYCGNQSTMDGKSFAKIAKDCKLISRKLTSTDVDLIFAKIKENNERRINFDQFSSGLEKLADKREVDLKKIEDRILQSSGPILHATKAEANKFHDDKSLYTGIHSKGSNSNNSIEKNVTPRRLEKSRRSSRDAREEATCNQLDEMAIEPDANQLTDAHRNLRSVFNSFSGNKRDLDGKTFAKLAKDCKIISRTCTSTDIDIIFAKVKEKAERRISFNQFKMAINHCAKKNAITYTELVSKISGTDGPVFVATKPEANKFYDDTSLYTGIHARNNSNAECK